MKQRFTLGVLIYLVFMAFLPAQLLLGQQGSCTNNRYKAEIFTVNRTENIPYGNAPALVYPPYVSENTTFNKQLVLDLYLPNADTLTKRPAIVMAFGGAFLLGWKQQPQLVDFCNAMARRGYVVAAIDYRLGFNLSNTQSAVRAVYRAAQDLKAAIRYLKHNAAVYGIDSNYVYAGGNSAGGISAIHAAYVSEAERAANPLMAATYTGGLFNAWPNLGCTECSGNNLGQPPFNISGTPDLVINLWGAIADLNFIQAPTDAPIISFHGLGDNIVLPDGGAPFSYPLFPTLYGSVAIAQRCNNVGVLNELHTFDFGHEVWILPDEALYIQEKTADFLYNYLKPATPQISGPATVCAGSMATYSVLPHINHTFCWQVQGGVIISSPQNTHTITVQWGNTNGSVSVRKLNRNLYESDAATYNVSVTAPMMPQNLLNTVLGVNSATLFWQGMADVQYEVSYALAGSDDWTTLTTTLSSATIQNLVACTRYEFRVRSFCDGAYSEYNTLSVTTDCLRAKVRLYLEGAFNLAAGSMNTALLTAGQIPAAQPFNTAPWNYEGAEFLAEFPANMVDWVLIETRSADDFTLVTDRSAGILLSNGFVWGIDGQEGVPLRNTPNAAPYYIVVKHRNHAPIMSKVPIPIPNAFAHNFTANPGQVYGVNQLMQISDVVYAMPAADYEQNGIINFADFNALQPFLSQTAQPYSAYDGNLDGVVNLQDFDLFAKNAGHITITPLR